jgi:4-hydroxyphenylpyruvate dioxygenase
VKTSIATVSLSGDLRSKLHAIASAGFDGIELFESDLLTFNGTPRVVREMVRDVGLEFVAFQPFRDFEGMPDAQRSQNLERAERKFDLMGELGTDLMLVCSNVSPLALGGLDRAAEDFFELGERAAKRGIRVGFEALAWGRHISDYRDAWEVVRRANHPNIGTILDTFHILAKGLEVNSMASIPKEKIFLVQVADAPTLEMGVLPWSRHFRNFPGQGRLPLDAFMRSLEAIRYDGFLSLEIFNDQFRAAPSRDTALDGYRSLVYLQELLPKVSPQRSLGSRNTPIETHGIGFIEFAVGTDVANQIARLFDQLGFQKIGQHRSKNVNLWRQGRAQFVINAESSGFAHEYNALHGSSVCAMALEVGGVQASLQRAKDFKYEILEPSVRPGEHEIPAIKGVDGSLIYLLEHDRTRDPLQGDDFWGVDFELQPGVSPNDAGLQSVDHIGQVLPSEKALSWLLFYRSIFAVNASDLTNIPDPSGLISSQVVENHDQQLRLVLNASQYSGTLAAKYLAGHSGGGVQHIAFASHDIFATLETWHDNAVPILPVAGNYYADLQARFGFEDDLIARMQHLGEFFHAYTQTFADLFFFEVCQRNGDQGNHYQGYGAANAAIRIASQTRLETGVQMAEGRES